MFVVYILHSYYFCWLFCFQYVILFASWGDEFFYKYVSPYLCVYEVMDLFMFTKNESLNGNLIFFNIKIIERISHDKSVRLIKDIKGIIIKIIYFKKYIISWK